MMKSAHFALQAAPATAVVPPPLPLPPPLLLLCLKLAAAGSLLLLPPAGASWCTSALPFYGMTSTSSSAPGTAASDSLLSARRSPCCSALDAHFAPLPPPFAPLRKEHKARKEVGAGWLAAGCWLLARGCTQFAAHRLIKVHQPCNTDAGAFTPPAACCSAPLQQALELTSSVLCPKGYDMTHYLPLLDPEASEDTVLQVGLCGGQLLRLVGGAANLQQTERMLPHDAGEACHPVVGVLHCGSSMVLQLHWPYVPLCPVPLKPAAPEHCAAVLPRLERLRQRLLRGVPPALPAGRLRIGCRGLQRLHPER